MLGQRISIRHSFLFMIVGLVVFVAYVYFFIGFGKVQFVFGQLNSVQFAGFYAAALLAGLTAVFCWAAAWKQLIQRLSVQITYRKMYLYYYAGYFIDSVIPSGGLGGEIVRIYLVQKQTRADYGVLAISAITNRILAYIIVTTGLVVTAVFIFLEPAFPSYLLGLFLFILAGACVFLAVLMYLALSRRAAGRLTSLFIRVYKRFRPKSYTQETEANLNKTLAKYYEGFSRYRQNLRQLLVPFVLHVFAYGLNLLSYALVFFALGITSITVGFVVVIYFITIVVQDASAAFSVGSLDITLATIFTVYGISTGAAGSAAIILRSMSFWFPLLVGFVSFQTVGAERALSRLGRKKPSGTHQSTVPSRKNAPVRCQLGLKQLYIRQAAPDSGWLPARLTHRVPITPSLTIKP